MRQSNWTLTFQTRGKKMYNITGEIEAWTRKQQFESGLLTAFVRHTSASLVIQENADPDVLHDLDNYLDRIIPREDPAYRHRLEGPDDMPAHIRSALTQTQLSIPLISGRLVLGTWQAIYLFEHRDMPQRREIVIHLFGE